MQTPVDLIILAGGAGTRMGGYDKGLMQIDGQPAAGHLIRRLLRPPDHLIISANRNPDSYRELGATVALDSSPGLGPLAGLLAAIPHCRHRIQLVVPCDMPWLPTELRNALPQLTGSQDISVLHDGTRLQPLCLALCASNWQESLSAYLHEGQRSARGWLADKAVRVCPVAADHEKAFININEPADLLPPDPAIRQP